MYVGVKVLIYSIEIGLPLTSSDRHDKSYAATHCRVLPPVEFNGMIAESQDLQLLVQSVLYTPCPEKKVPLIFLL